MKTLVLLVAVVAAVEGGKWRKKHGHDIKPKNPVGLDFEIKKLNDRVQMLEKECHRPKHDKGMEQEIKVLRRQIESNDRSIKEVNKAVEKEHRRLDKAAKDVSKYLTKHEKNIHSLDKALSKLSKDLDQKGEEVFDAIQQTQKKAEIISKHLEELRESVEKKEENEKKTGNKYYNRKAWKHMKRTYVKQMENAARSGLKNETLTRHDIRKNWKNMKKHYHKHTKKVINKANGSQGKQTKEENGANGSQGKQTKEENGANGSQGKQTKEENGVSKEFKKAKKWVMDWTSRHGHQAADWLSNTFSNFNWMHGRSGDDDKDDEAETPAKDGTQPEAVKTTTMTMVPEANRKDLATDPGDDPNEYTGELPVITAPESEVRGPGHKTEVVKATGNMIPEAYRRDLPTNPGEVHDEPPVSGVPESEGNSLNYENGVVKTTTMVPDPEVYRKQLPTNPGEEAKATGNMIPETYRRDLPTNPGEVHEPAAIPLPESEVKTLDHEIGE